MTTGSGPSSRWPSPAEELAALRERARQVVPAARAHREPRRWWAWAAWGVTASAWVVGLVAVVSGPESFTIWDDGRLEQMGRLEAAGLLLFLGMLLLPLPWLSRLLFSERALPWVNVPHKEFWVRTPRRLARAERLMWEVCAVLTLWCGALVAAPVLGVVLGSRNGAPPEWVVPASLGAVPVLLVWLVVTFDPERAAADLPLEDPGERP
ncbi:hypothetical protein [Kytococcus sedentarius]|uniref:hypothetical protein n=1 Tax=Kytococcus sedentarius TaxID=1276 RepID=UPI0035BC2B1E